MPIDLTPVWLTVRLAFTATFLLLLISTPLAWWLAHSKSPMRPVINALVTLPLVLPPTVLGFYLLLFMGPHGPLGQLTESLGLGLLPFTFWGLVIGSIIYSLPFVVQPIQNSFESIGSAPLEAAATLGAGATDRFFSVAVPLASRGFFTACILGMAHTIGEFGVALMIGGNIPGQTKVISVAIYEDVEALEYAQAHWLAGGMLIFSFTVLLIMHWRSSSYRIGGQS